MLRQRIISAVVMLLVFILVNFFTDGFVFSAAMSLLAGFAGWEWARLNGLDKATHQIAYALLAAILSLALVLALPLSSELGLVVKALSLAVAVFWAAVGLIFYKRPLKSPANGRIDTLSLLAGLFLLGSCVYFSCLLHADVSGGSAWLFLYAMCTVWVMDIGAYFAGKRFGKNKLAPVISPGKTWEGVVGGLLCAFIVAFGVIQLAGFSEPRRLALVAGTVFAAAASILGDLYESRMKRAAGFKDSSQLIPGHGGILDRIDGVIAAVPVFAFAWVWL